MAEIIKRICKQMNEKEFFKVVQGDDAKQKRIMLYKFFFFNYMFSVTVQDVVRVCFSAYLEESKQEEEGSKSTIRRKIVKSLTNKIDTMEELPNLAFRVLAMMLDA
eukprot:CAMPEP_0202980106 /NCGR_PEP_ID=MMETSP1396-20130829/86096_1 /ASSEMBLY_ACC=CAM_ASM_000872 /TAXON_ID= /ORGANISM="Pseudokeronopsis sp., Strain Brazil" /LENGTH=105 /DNA_ID=CAMNT_0049719877 /DNA_START=508 /DNA_END=821 /DNA_ORIENTATION=-